MGRFCTYGWMHILVVAVGLDEAGVGLDPSRTVCVGKEWGGGRRNLVFALVI